MKVGILGGTFNPVHNGHLKIAGTAMRRLKLDHVLFVPARVPPLRSSRGVATARHRFEMVRLATQKYPRFLISSVEMERPGKSYAVDTLKILRKIYKKGTQFYFIVGADCLPQLHAWREIGKLSRLCEFAVVTRGGFQLKKLKPADLKLTPAVFRRVTRHLISIAPVKVSATVIRERTRAKKSLTGLVPKEVARYILKNKLYR